MITRRIRLQLIAFVLLTAIAVTYTGFRYAGFGNLFGATTYPVTLQSPDSGGIFTGADVTYRGVSVGRVGPLTLTDAGVDVQLDIDKSAPSIPADVDAMVANLSPIGEQHVDLRPQRDDGPVLAAGSVIPASRVKTPVPVETVVLNLDNFLRSVPLESLRTVVDELGTGFTDTAQPLQRLLDSTSALTKDAIEALPPTLRLIRDGRTVLTTQVAQASQFRSFSRDLNLLAQQLRTSDPDLRRLITDTPRLSTQLIELLRESGRGISMLIADLLTVAKIAEPRQDALRQILVTYPKVTVGGFTVLPGDGTAHLGLVLNAFDPLPCTRGYAGTTHRTGSELSDVPVNEAARCAEPPGSPIDVRGAQNVPRGGAAASPADGSSGWTDSNSAGPAPRQVHGPADILTEQ